ncbi:MAG: hypothetical protein KTR27_11685 [Leptolyngbyaceae cyanobacterium MAG.088]|nr:hypothetical protein [Leptolyngbyaceae cyanobacterium MAG.088]
MLSTIPVIQSTTSYAPEVMDVLSSMCQAAQPQTPQPIARWIMEEGQLLGVLVASLPSPPPLSTATP